MVTLIAELRDPSGHLAGKLVRLRDGRLAVEVKCDRNTCQCLHYFDATTGAVIAVARPAPDLRAKLVTIFGRLRVNASRMVE